MRDRHKHTKETRTTRKTTNKDKLTNARFSDSTDALLENIQSNIRQKINRNLIGTDWNKTKISVMWKPVITR